MAIKEKTGTRSTKAAHDGLAVRFASQPAANGRRRRWRDWLPSRWRRQVVIQGQRFWLPG